MTSITVRRVGVSTLTKGAAHALTRRFGRIPAAIGAGLGYAARTFMEEALNVSNREGTWREPCPESRFQRRPAA